MKRISVAGLLILVVLILSGLTAAGSASAACLKIHYFAWYKDSACTELAIIFSWKGWDLTDSKEGKEVESGVLCVKVEGAAPSDYDGPNCGPSEEVEGTGEYVRTEKEETGEPKMVLPEFTLRPGWKGTGGTSKFVNSKEAAEINCSSGTSSGGIEGTFKSGAFTLTLKGCKGKISSLSVKCKSEGDAEETILTTGSWHLVLTTHSGVDKHLIWFVLKEQKLECTELAKVTVKGNVLGEITPAGTKAKVFSINLAVKGGTQEFTSFENDSGVNVVAHLESNVNGGAFSTSTVETAENKIETEKNTEIIN
jgi:hypothetical protein